MEVAHFPSRLEAILADGPVLRGVRQSWRICLVCLQVALLLSKQQALARECFPGPQKRMGKEESLTGGDPEMAFFHLGFSVSRLVGLHIQGRFGDGQPLRNTQPLKRSESCRALWVFITTWFLAAPASIAHGFCPMWGLMRYSSPKTWVVGYACLFLSRLGSFFSCPWGW